VTVSRTSMRRRERLGAAESILFQQPARIDAAVAKLVRPAGDTPWASSSALLDTANRKSLPRRSSLPPSVSRSATTQSQRTLLLINDRRSRDDSPLASGTALSHALKGVASKMNIDRDILFPDAVIPRLGRPAAVGDERLAAIARSHRDVLAEALRESGIKWRVIVISAWSRRSIHRAAADENTIVNHRGQGGSHIVRLL